MTRWLQASKMASGAFDTTDIIDTTPFSSVQKLPESTWKEPRIAEVSSVLSVVSKGGKADFGNGEGAQSSPSSHDPDALKMEFEERAAVLEYDGGHSREEAERLARLQVYGANAEKEDAQ